MLPGSVCVFLSWFAVIIIIYPSRKRRNSRWGNAWMREESLEHPVNCAGNSAERTSCKLYCTSHSWVWGKHHAEANNILQETFYQFYPETLAGYFFRLINQNTSDKIPLVINIALLILNLKSLLTDYLKCWKIISFPHRVHISWLNVLIVPFLRFLDWKEENWT